MIAYCQANALVWVTKDWNAATVEAEVKRLTAAGVSAWWLREERRKQMSRPELLFVVARDIEIVAFANETSAGRPVYIVASVGRRARTIPIPFATRRATRALPAPPRPRPRKRIPGGVELFPD